MSEIIPMIKEIKFRTGCSGYYNRHWKTIFYPEKLPQQQWFNFYAGQLNTVELNTTFYRFPTAEKLNEWYKKSPAEFLFSVKAPRLITHLKKFNDCQQQVNELFCKIFSFFFKKNWVACCFNFLQVFIIVRKN